MQVLVTCGERVQSDLEALSSVFWLLVIMSLAPCSASLTLSRDLRLCGAALSVARRELRFLSCAAREQETLLTMTSNAFPGTCLCSACKTDVCLSEVMKL